LKGKMFTSEKKVMINDSKKLKPRQRKISSEWIRENAIIWGIGEASVAEINRVGIGKATSSAFRRAVSNANKRPQDRVDYLLIDAFYIPYIRGLPMRRKKARKDHNLKDGRARQLAIKNGDQKSLSIAAASIVAKEYRDNIMKSLGEKPRYKRYLWVNNKGYGTKEHGKAIKKYGISKYHRTKFVETFLKKK
ncbi:MAG: ribonuclease HII, partial [Patescibacteria group bacterium]